MTSILIFPITLFLASGCFLLSDTVIPHLSDFVHVDEPSPEEFPLLCPNNYKRCRRSAETTFVSFFINTVKELNSWIQESGSLDLVPRNRNFGKQLLLAQIEGNFDACLHTSVSLFQDLFYKSPHSILKRYPPTIENGAFWFDQRPPQPLAFDPNAELDIEFVSCCSVAIAKILNIAHPASLHLVSERVKFLYSCSPKIDLGTIEEEDDENEFWETVDSSRYSLLSSYFDQQEIETEIETTTKRITDSEELKDDIVACLMNLVACCSLLEPSGRSHDRTNSFSFFF